MERWTSSTTKLRGIKVLSVFLLNFSHICGEFSCLGIPQRSDLYLNNMAVKKAIHANPDVHWEECGGIDYTTNVQSTIPYLEAIFDLAPGIPYMIYRSVSKSRCSTIFSTLIFLLLDCHGDTDTVQWNG